MEAQVRPAPKATSRSRAPGWQPAAVARLGQRQRDRRRGGVPVPLDVAEHAVRRDAEALDGVLDDPAVGLVGHDEVDLRDAHLEGSEKALDRLDHHARGEAEDLGAVHLDVPLRCGRSARHRRAPAARRDDQVVAPPPSAPMSKPRKPVVVSGSPAVTSAPPAASAEQDAGGAVGRVGDARQHLGPHDEHRAGDAALDHRDRLRQAVDEARARGRQVERGGVARADVVGHQGRGGREEVVGRGGGHDHHVDGGRVDAGGGEDPLGGARPRGRSRPRSRRPSGARGCPCARRSTRRWSRPTARSRRW